MLSVSAETTVFVPETRFVVPVRAGKTGRPRGRLRPDTEPEAIETLIARLGAEHAQPVTFRDRSDGEPMTSRFVFVRVRAETPREEWLIAEWPEGRDEPTDYWISNLPADTEPERLARLAQLRWTIAGAVLRRSGRQPRPVPLGHASAKRESVEDMAPARRPAHGGQGEA